MAFGSRVAGIRMLDGSVTDILEAQSFVYKAHVNHIYSCSWGPEDNGRTIEGPGKLAQVSTNNFLLSKIIQYYCGSFLFIFFKFSPCFLLLL